MSIFSKRISIGFLQGIILAVLHFTWSANYLSLLLPITMITVFVPLLIMHSMGNLRLKTMLIWGVSATVILWGIAYYAVFRQMLPQQNLIVTSSLLTELIFFTGGALFIAHVLVISGDSDQRFMANYSSYFDMSWKLWIQIAFSAAFTLLFWMLLWLGASLFEIIHLNFFKNIITNYWFAIPATTLAISVALHLTDVNVNIVRGVRTLILVLLAWLLPLITGIISLFLLSLFYTGPTLLWQTGHAGMLLLIAAITLIILINATYQDGQNSPTTIKRYSAQIACCLLIPLIALAVYALYLRVQQYGWSVSRIEAAAIMIIVVSYAFSYTLAAYKLKHIERGNFANACLILVVYLLLFTPIADPARLAAANQLHRLQSGQTTPEKFDFQALRTEDLRFGFQALQELQNNWHGPQAEYVRAQTKALLAQKNIASLDVNKKKVLTAETKGQLIIAHTKDGKLPASFLNQQWDYVEGSIGIPSCLTSGNETCNAWIVQDHNKSDIILLLSDNGFTGFQQNDQKTWIVIGDWRIPYSCKEKLREAALGNFKMVSLPSPQPDIEIMGWHARFNPNQDMGACH